VASLLYLLQLLEEILTKYYALAILDINFLSTLYGSGSGREETAFDRLVLPEGHKSFIVSLVVQHFRNKDRARESRSQEVDIVRGKGRFVLATPGTQMFLIAVLGKGLVLLLHGAPGVGKSTTAGRDCYTSARHSPVFLLTTLLG
jgi:hypothetical protein